MRRSEIAEISARETRKSGSSDVNSNWAQARLVFAKQLKVQFDLGKLSPDHSDVINSPFKPIYLDGYVSWDEKHLKQKVGLHTKLEYRFRKNCDGEYASEKFQGKLPEKNKKVSLKFEQEARSLLGCAIVKQPDDTMDVFDYLLSITLQD